MHPYDVQSDRCPDFQASAIVTAQHEQFINLDWVAEDGASAQWEPEGASYYGNELVITTEQRWNREQKAALLDWHPLFTGRCPSCEVSLPQTEPPRVD